MKTFPLALLLLLLLLTLTKAKAKAKLDNEIDLFDPTDSVLKKDLSPEETHQLAHLQDPYVPTGEEDIVREL